MDKFKEIRPIVLGLVVKNGKTLVSQGCHIETNEIYYRPLGGGIEFLETIEKALKREFQEELGIDSKVNSYLGFIDNIFKYEGKDAHEHIFIYSVDILDKDVKDEYVFYEGDVSHKAMWIDIEDVKNGTKKIYPLEITKYL